MLFKTILILVHTSRPPTTSAHRLCHLLLPLPLPLSRRLPLALLRLLVLLLVVIRCGLFRPLALCRRLLLLGLLNILVLAQVQLLILFLFDLDNLFFIGLLNSLLKIRLILAKLLRSLDTGCLDEGQRMVTLVVPAV